MSRYFYVDTQRSYNNSHVLHTTGYRYLPADKDRKFLGTFYTVSDALQQAKKYYPDSWGCNHCCPESEKAPGIRKMAKPLKKSDLRPPA